LLTQNKHKIIVSSCSQAGDAAKHAKLGQTGGIRGKKVTYKATLICQNNSSYSANFIAQQAKEKGSNQGANKKEGLSNARLISIITNPIQLK